MTRVGGKVAEAKCLLCEGLSIPDTTTRTGNVYLETIREAASTFAMLVKSDAFSEGRRVRV